MMDAIQKKLLEQVADLHDVPQGAYSLRINGNLYGKNDSENISIVAKSDKQGIDTITGKRSREIIKSTVRTH